MNWQHLTAFLWLRWRLWVNQWRRAGSIIILLMTVLAAVSVATAIPLLIACFVAGIYLIPRAAPVHLMYAWDGVLVGFAFFWMIGLITELQRTEPLSLSKFLHLPVSVNGAFVINYVSSLLRLSLIVFVPIMFGFCLALIYSKGMLMVLALPSLAAFLLMVTALTYQFQGWLASLMSNPRRRRTVIVATTMIFILIVQLPNLLNISTGFWGTKRSAEQRVTLQQEMDKEFSQKMDKLGRDAQEEDRSGRMQEMSLNHNLAVSQRVQHAMQQSQRKHGTPGTHGPACQPGRASGLAPFGSDGFGRGKRHAGDSGAVGNDADRLSQSLAGVPHDDRAVSRPIHNAESPARAPWSHRRPTPRSPACCCSKDVCPVSRSRFRPLPWGACARSCGRPRRR